MAFPYRRHYVTSKSTRHQHETTKARLKQNHVGIITQLMFQNDRKPDFRSPDF